MLRHYLALHADLTLYLQPGVRAEVHLAAVVEFGDEHQDAVMSLYDPRMDRSSVLLTRRCFCCVFRRSPPSSTHALQNVFVSSLCCFACNSVSRVSSPPVTKFSHYVLASHSSAVKSAFTSPIAIPWFFDSRAGDAVPLARGARLARRTARDAIPTCQSTSLHVTTIFAAFRPGHLTVGWGSGPHSNRPSRRRECEMTDPVSRADAAGG